MIEAPKAKVTDWHNAPSRYQDKAENSKKTAEEWKKKSDGERKRCQEAVAKYSEAKKTQGTLKLQLEKAQERISSLSVEMKSLKKSDLD